MAQNVLVSQLITDIRSKADMQNTQFITDTELISYIDKAYRKIHNKLVNTFQNYFVSEATITLVSGTNEYDLPSDFLKLLGLDLNNAGKPYSLKPWSLNERNRIMVGWNGKPLFYIIKGSKVLLRPNVNVNDTLTLYYAPCSTEITSSSQQIDCVNGLNELIILDCCIQCKAKEESDFSVFELQYQQMEKELFDFFTSRDDALPMKMTDVNNMNDSYWFYYYGV